MKSMFVYVGQKFIFSIFESSRLCISALFIQYQRSNATLWNCSKVMKCLTTVNIIFS